MALGRHADMSWAVIEPISLCTAAMCSVAQLIRKIIWARAIGMTSLNFLMTSSAWDLDDR